jgi:hypothetical protein
MLHSPEHRPGAGSDQHKWSGSGRWDGTIRGSPFYGLVEWARTSEARGFFVFHSLLAEAAWTTGRNRIHYRFERTERPEEARTQNLFRSTRPHHENSIQGITRWSIHTAGYGFQLGEQAGPVSALPFVELSYGRLAEIEGGVFSVSSLYGRHSFISASVGVRLSLGMQMHRMGRYGVVQDTAGTAHPAQHGSHDD